MNSSRSITILHLSDLHFTPSADENDETRGWHKALLDDIHQCTVNKRTDIDFVVISGDLTMSARKSEFKAAGNFIRSLLATVRAPRENLILVPGNHDLSWSEPLPFIRERFFELAKQFASSEVDVRSVTREFEDKNIVFFTPGVASVENAGDAAGLGRSYEDCLRRSAEQRTTFVAVLHGPAHRQHRLEHAALAHPFWEESLFKSYLMKCDLLLHGHVHETVSHLTKSSPGGIALGAGPLSCEAWRRWHGGPPLYHILQIRDDSIEINTRLFVSQINRWLDQKAFPVQDKRLTTVSPDANELVVQSDDASKTIRQLVDRLCEITEYDLMGLVNDLAVAVPDYAPLRESRESYAQRLVSYFAKDGSLDYLHQCLSRRYGTETNRKLNVFLSSTWDGLRVAEQVADLCERHGIDTWLAGRSLRGGDDFELEIRRAIQRSDFFVLILSPAMANSKWMNREIGFALQNEGGAPKIVPVRTGGAELPDALQGFTTVDCDPNDTIPSDSLLRALQSK